MSKQHCECGRELVLSRLLFRVDQFLQEWFSRQGSDGRPSRIGQDHFAAAGAVLRPHLFEQGGQDMRARVSIAALAALLVAVTLAAGAAAQPAAPGQAAAPTDVHAAFFTNWSRYAR